MAALLMKRCFTKVIKNLNEAKCGGTIIEMTRTRMGNLEKVWLKEKAVKLMERAKAEKGMELKVDPKATQMFYEDAEEYKTANDVIKKLLSMQYASRVDVRRFELRLLQREFGNVISAESLDIQIALATLHIRRMTDTLIREKTRNKRLEFLLFRMILKRDRLMYELSGLDGRRYDAIKERINLPKFQPYEPMYPYKRVTRYDKSTTEMKNQARRARAQMIESERLRNDERKPSFFKLRNEALKRIQNELKDLGFNLNLPNPEKFTLQPNKPWFVADQLALKYKEREAKRQLLKKQEAVAEHQTAKAAAQNEEQDIKNSQKATA